MRVLAIVLLLATPAHAESIAYDDDESPPTTKLGFQLGGGHIPLLDAALSAVQLGIGVEHPVFARLRVLAEYEWLWLSEEPDVVRMTTDPAGMGHRTHVGLRRAFAEKDLDVIRFFADLELGGGLGLYQTPTGVDVEPHGFVGLRGGYELREPRARASRTFEVELHARAIVVERGIGFGGGIGFAWGD